MLVNTFPCEVYGRKVLAGAETQPKSGSANLMVLVKLCSDDTCCHGNEKLGILPGYLP